MRRLSYQDHLILGFSLVATFVLFISLINWGDLVFCMKNYRTLNCLPTEELIGLKKIYDDKLRSDFFSGFLAVGAFLLSLKTFIVMTMKTNVYDTESYKETWENNKRLNSNIGTRYSGLRELNRSMFSAIFYSLVAAVFQVTLGLIESITLVFISFNLCAISIAYLSYCLFLVKRNLDSIIPE